MRGLLTALTTLVALGLTGAVHAADMDGNWARGDGVAKVRVASCGSNVCATNTWIKPGTKGEKAGDVLVMTIKPVSEGKYAGTAFDPQRNLNYKINVTVKDSRMTTKGCVLGGLICKDVGWSRIQ